MIELYSISDVFVLPSISDANPLTCIEALWTELPLFISENCGNYPEVIEQGKMDIRLIIKILMMQ